MRSPFSLLIKPASSSCNLRCAYCFARRTGTGRAEASRRMDVPVLERLIRTYLATEQPSHIFIWQGGEPVLMGEEFFRKVIELQVKYCRRGAVIANGLQTNGTLLTDNLCRLLQRYNFLVGCSLDGPPSLHDRYRVTAEGRPSHAAVMEGIDKLRRYRVDFNVLVLVSRANVAYADEVYTYLREQDFRFQQYIPCVEFDSRGEPAPYAITGAEWGDFLCRIFARWHPQDMHTISIRNFDTILARMVRGEVQTCTAGTQCSHYFAVEHNGDVYPCDFYVREEYRLGNILEQEWGDLLVSPMYVDFGNRKSTWCRSCGECEYLELCAGDCPRHRVVHHEPGGRQSWLCEGWKAFFRENLGKFEDIACQIR